MLFRNRFDAGRALGEKLLKYRGRPDVLVLALPRGGVPVAFEAADVIGAPLDVFFVRKLGLPGHEEYAIGAVATGDVQVINQSIVEQLGVPTEAINVVIERELCELHRQQERFRGQRPPPQVEGRTVILIDDGLATGVSMRAAIESLRRQGPSRVVVAVPVGSASTCIALEREADELICVARPSEFLSVGAWYDDFRQTPDETVERLLREAELRAAWRPPSMGLASSATD